MVSESVIIYWIVCFFIGILSATHIKNYVMSVVVSSCLSILLGLVLYAFGLI